jgi:hypothetical protein
MKINHPLSSILRKRKYNQFDFDLVIANAYFSGQFGRNIPVEESREVIQHLVRLAIKKSNQHPSNKRGERE